MKEKPGYKKMKENHLGQKYQSEFNIFEQAAKWGKNGN